MGRAARPAGGGTAVAARAAPPAPAYSKRQRRAGCARGQPHHPAPPRPAPASREYNAWLAEAAGCPEAQLPPWRAAMYAATGASKRAHPEDYRDRWDDAASLAAATQHLREQEAALGPAVAAAAAAAAAGGP